MGGRRALVEVVHRVEHRRVHPLLWIAHHHRVVVLRGVQRVQPVRRVVVVVVVLHLVVRRIVAVVGVALARQERLGRRTEPGGVARHAGQVTSGG